MSRGSGRQWDPEEPAGGKTKEWCWSLYFLLKRCLRIPPPLQESSLPFSVRHNIKPCTRCTRECVCVWILCIYMVFYIAFSGGSAVKNLPAKRESWVRSLGGEDPLEKRMATHFSILAWRIRWTEEPGEL